MKVFVYGTLKKGKGSHRLLSSAEFLGEAVTTPDFTMYDFGYFPAVVAGGESGVLGEVYTIGKKIRRRLDTLEGHPNYYQRELIDTPYGRAYIYLMPEDRLFNNPPIVHSGEWK